MNFLAGLLLLLIVILLKMITTANFALLESRFRLYKVWISRKRLSILILVEAMRQLIGHAHVITPNLTEAAFLLGEPYRPDIPPDALKEQLRRLADMGPDRVVITSAPAARPGHCAAVAYDRRQGRFWKMESPYIPAFYPGTGDTFSSVLVGAFLQGDSLPVALERAVRFVTLGIRVTYGYDTRHSDGVLLERTLPALQDRCAIGEYEAF